MLLMRLGGEAIMKIVVGRRQLDISGLGGGDPHLVRIDHVGLGRND